LIAGEDVATGSDPRSWRDRLHRPLLWYHCGERFHHEERRAVHPNEQAIRQGFESFSKCDVDVRSLHFEVHDVLGNDGHAVALVSNWAERDG
jgi:hypothetical protein